MIDFRFYLVTDRTLCAPRTLASVVHDACVSGVRAVQLREKDFSAPDVVSSTTRLVGLMHPQQAKLFVNVATVEDDTLGIIAASPGVDGFHVPDDPALLAHIRRLFPKHLVGASTHSADGVRAAAEAGADFVTFGPVFGTGAKTKAQGLDKLSGACAAAAIPVFAIGGITADRAKECLDAGAHGVAAIRAIMTATSAR
ncbi:MAG TPA: thiamine phosphate synthase, partial [Candidatus Krumholzibacteria bacterium]